MAEKAKQTANARARPIQIPGVPAMPKCGVMPGFAEGTEMWVKAMGDQQGRVVAMMDEVSKGDEKALLDCCGAQEKELVLVRGGHVGAVVGGKASTVLYPAITTWLRRKLCN